MQFDATNIDIHLFDCDGVLLDSNEFKVHAIETSLQNIGCPKEAIDSAVLEFRKNFGRTRIDHFKSFKTLASSAGFELSDSLLNLAMDRYSEEVIQLYKSCNRIESAARFLSKIGSSKNIFVVSASDQGELREILPSHFSRIKPSQIFGGPVSKIDNLRFVLNRNHNNPAVFYGDSVQDAKAAVFNNIKFIGLTKYSADPLPLTRYCREMNFPVYEDLEQVRL